MKMRDTGMDLWPITDTDVTPAVAAHVVVAIIDAAAAASTVVL
jgi:hypothetical protein